MLTVLVNITENNVFNVIASDIMSDAKPAFQAASELIPDFVRDNFAKSGETGGNHKWPRLSFSAFQLRKTFPHGAPRAVQLRAYEYHRPLEDTLTLLKSFRLTSDGLRDFDVSELAYMPDYVLAITGTDVEYGAQHDSGTDNTKKRQHMYIAEEFLPMLHDAFESNYGRGV